MGTLLTWVAGALLTWAPADELETALQRLSAASADERRSAEQWLAVNLRAEDYAALADVAVGAPAEVRTRLLSALSSDERHFGLVALLLSDDDPGLEVLGEAALERLWVQWSGSRPSLPLTGTDLLSRLVGRFSGWYQLDANGLSIDAAAELIARYVPSRREDWLETEPVRLVVDPALHVMPRGFGGAGARGLVWTGAFDELVRAVAEVGDVELEGFSLADGRRPWCFLRPRDVSARRDLEHVAAWIRAVARGSDPLAAEASARALASLEWPAALEWLGARWGVAGDEAAFRGLLLAASRTRVAPLLHTEAGIRALLETGLEAYREDRASSLARETLAALMAVGPTGPRGQDWAAWSAGTFWKAGADARDQHYLLALYSEWGRVPAEIDAGGGGPSTWWGNAGVEPSLLFASLRAFASEARPREVSVGWSELRPLLLASSHPAEVRALWSWVERLGIELDPSADAEVLAGLAGTPLAEEIALARIEAHVADTSSAAGVVAALCAGVGPVAAAEALERAGRLHGFDPADAVSGATDLTPGLARTLAVLLARPGADDEVSAQADAVLGSLPPAPQRSDSDWVLVGAALARVGEDAPAWSDFRDLVKDSLDVAETGTGSLDDGWVRGFERAWRDLARAGEDQRAAGLLRFLRRSARKSSHPVRSRLNAGDWPLPPDVVPVPLGPPGRLDPLAD